jgi:hypothetical protein
VAMLMPDMARVPTQSPVAARRERTMAATPPKTMISIKTKNIHFQDKLVLQIL